MKITYHAIYAPNEPAAWFTTANKGRWTDYSTEAHLFLKKENAQSMIDSQELTKVVIVPVTYDMPDEQFFIRKNDTVRHENSYYNRDTQEFDVIEIVDLKSALTQHPDLYLYNNRQDAVDDFNPLFHYYDYEIRQDDEEGETRDAQQLEIIKRTMEIF